jgi:hypothetical protein
MGNMTKLQTIKYHFSRMGEPTYDESEWDEFCEIHNYAEAIDLIFHTIHPWNEEDFTEGTLDSSYIVGVRLFRASKLIRKKYPDCTTEELLMLLELEK